MPKPPKVAAPNPFNGNCETLDDFLLTQCRLYLTRRQDDYPDDIKILFVLSYMKEGTAAPWTTEKVMV
jgi:hypothetical protein